MRKPELLDLFCKAGGAARGYQQAGFRVIGVDIEPQPNYCGDDFIQYDACEYLNDLNSAGTWELYDAFHASPPCQAFTAYRRKGDGVGEGYENLIPFVRSLLRASGLPYVIENVPGAPLENPVQLCGTGFGLDVQRHRLFETSWPLMGMPCSHGRHAPRFKAATNRAENSRRTVEIGVYRIPLDVQKQAMGVDWHMTLDELSNAIPPAYTEHIGQQLIAHLQRGNSPHDSA